MVGGGFGAPATSGFGSTGGSTFGSSSSAPSGGFGASPATSTFGSTTNSSPFGAPAPSPSAFGTTQTSTFGGTPGASAFGAPSPAPTFGGTSAFGTPAPAPGTTSAFGGGGFGSTTTTSTFGAPAPSSAFGSTGGFGAPSPAPGSTGLFGAPAPAPTGGMFGAPATTPGSTFGSSPGGTSLFGGGSTAAPGAMTPTGQVPAWAAGQPPMGNGTRPQPYAPTVRNDGQSTITFQTITAMNQYENYSLEELRLQDYALGNRGNAAQPGASPGGGLFGAPAPALGGFGSPAPAPTGGGLFGAPSPAPAFGASPAPSTGFGSTFNTPAPAPFGAPAPSAFGTPAPAPGGLFGGAPTSTFGQPAPAPTSAFGTPAPAPGGLFGAPAPSTFGSQPSPAPATPGLFGAPQPAPAPGGGLFGSTGGGFGTPTPAPAPGFGGFGSTLGAAPAPSTGLFGAPQPAPAPGSGFGGFGAAPAPTSSFGTPAPAGGGLFGATAPGGFGQPPSAPTSTFGAAPSGGLFGGASTSMFGAPAPAPPTTFGAAPSNAGFGGAPAYGSQPAPPAMIHPTGNIMPPATNELVAAQLAAMEEKRKEMEKSDNFQNQPLASSAVAAASESESSAMRSLALLRPSYPVYHAMSPSNAKIRPRGFASPPDNGITSQSISNLGTGGRPMATPEVVAATSSTRLQINPKPKPKLKLSLPPSNGIIQKEGGEGSNVTPKNGLTNGSLRSPPPAMQSAGGSDRHDPVSTPQPPSQQKNGRTPSSSNTGASVSATKTAIRNVAYEHYLKASGDASDTENSAMNGSYTPVVDSKVSSVVPKLSKPEYRCSPSIAELQQMPPEDLAAVSNFSVERAGVGKIEWQGAVDVRNANLDSLVVIEPKSIQVYHEEEENNTKPAVGTKLNRPAVLTMYGIFPREGSDAAKFAQKIESSTAKMGADLIDYDHDSGVWVLLVKHF